MTSPNTHTTPLKRIAPALKLPHLGLGTYGALLLASALASGCDDVSVLERASEDTPRETLEQLTELNAEGFDSCTDEELERVADFVLCLEAERSAACEEAGSAACEGDLFSLPAPADVCPPPAELDAACAEAIAPAQPQWRADEPLDCGSAQFLVDAARLAYFDDPGLPSYHDYQPPMVDTVFGPMKLPVTAWTLYDTYSANHSFGYISVLGDNTGACVVGFRGTDDFEDVIDDLTSVVLSSCGDVDGKCGHGFYNAYQDIEDSGLVDDLIKLVNNGVCEEVQLTGHSLGGALADILSAHLYEYDPDTFNKDFMRVETFGQPRVFNSPAASKYHDAVRKTRWMRWGDTVTGLPEISFFHSGTGRLIDKTWSWNSLSYEWSFHTTSQDAAALGVWPSNHLSNIYETGLDHCG